jgi:orotate phosphoribosyltransferase
MSRDLIAEYAEKLAMASLSTGSIRLQPEAPFRWASGYYMPIYNDNRMLLASWEHRRLVAEAFVKILEKEGCDFDLIAGTATAGIPHATSLADLLKKPLVYVRGASKGHGLENRIEGVSGKSALEERKVVLVEDLISTGGSSISAVEALRYSGAKTDLCLAIFSYGLEKAEAAFASLKPPCRCLPVLEYDRLIEIALAGGYIDQAASEQLLDWRSDPFGWGEKNGFAPEGGG